MYKCTHTVSPPVYVTFSYQTPESKKCQVTIVLLRGIKKKLPRVTQIPGKLYQAHQEL